MVFTDAPALSVIVPVYNEESNLFEFHNRLINCLNSITADFEVLYCLDPSSDKSEAILTSFSINDSKIKLIRFSRRFGQPAATMAGLSFARGLRNVVIDADLQDPPEVIIQLNSKMNEGYDVVYATRKNREGETLLKRLVSTFGYKVINRLTEIKIPENTGDFRIMSRRVVDEILKLQEQHGFLRGLVSFVGFKQCSIEYVRDRRFAGAGKYNRYLGSLKIGLNGLIGFSAKPLNYMSAAGGFVSLCSFIVGLWYLVQNLLGINITPGLSTTVILLSFYAGIQLLSLGLLGEYVSRIYDEVKGRPMFIVEKKINLDD
jgi:dolichol-phosphate mannosyltransferase